MNQTKIDWADATWNPVTGCRHGCTYCYARGIARRFGGWDVCGPAELIGSGLAVMDEPMKRIQKNGRMTKAAFPFYFDPTFHRYRLDNPARKEKPCNIFVCSMADLFGRWVPTSWITQVMDACLVAPQHNYLFLTKNPERYAELDKLAILPRKGNFWYGTTVTTENESHFFSNKHNTFVSVEPMYGPVDGHLLTDWVIVGAETGHRPGKKLPKREWVLELAEGCEQAGVPVFMKENLVKEGVLTQEEIIRQWPDGLTFA